MIKLGDSLKEMRETVNEDIRAYKNSHKKLEDLEHLKWDSSMLDIYQNCPKGDETLKRMRALRCSLGELKFTCYDMDLAQYSGRFGGKAGFLT